MVVTIKLLNNNLVKLLPKPPNKYSINTVIKYYEHMIHGDHFDLAPVSESSILTISKATKFQKQLTWRTCLVTF